MARIYLCEDDASFRLLTRLHLEQRGHTVVGEAADGPGCLDALVSADVDVALLDGVVGGAAAWSRLRTESPGTALVLYSGMPDGQLAGFAQEVSADAWLSKGAPADELAALVDRVAG